MHSFEQNIGLFPYYLHRVSKEHSHKKHIVLCCSNAFYGCKCDKDDQKCLNLKRKVIWVCLNWINRYFRCQKLSFPQADLLLCHCFFIHTYIHKVHIQYVYLWWWWWWWYYILADLQQSMSLRKWQKGSRRFLLERDVFRFTSCLISEACIFQTTPSSQTALGVVQFLIFRIKLHSIPILSYKNKKIF